MLGFLQCACGQTYAGLDVGPDGEPECPSCRRAREEGPAAREPIAPNRAGPAAGRNREPDRDFTRPSDSPRCSLRRNPIRFLISVSIAVVCFLAILLVFANLAMRVAVLGFDGICLSGLVVMFVLYLVARTLLRPFATG